MLDEIEKIINKHSGEQRGELIGFYKNIVSDTIESDSVLDKKKIILVLDLLKYIPSSEKQLFVSKVVNIKTFQVRTYILNTFDDDFQLEKEHFSKVSKWMLSVIEEVKNTFYNKKSDPLNIDLVTQFHEKFSEEIRLIFCSNERFNTAGNQLLIDVLKYFDSFEEAGNFKNELVGRIRRNFNPGKVFSNEKLNEIVENISETT